jgi:Leucine-rich repeat (LRR) protein
VQAELTRDDIAILSREGVKVILAGEDASQAHRFAADVSPETLANAELLDLSGVALKDHPAFFTWLAQFKNLRYLSLRNTGVHASPDLLNSFVGKEKLQKLDLSENALFADPYSTVNLSSLWGNLSRLDELTLTATGGNVENYGSLALLKNLSLLRLGNNPHLCERSLLNRLTDWSGASCLKGLELSSLPLIELDLSNTGLNADPLPDLPVASLQSLSLEQNQLSTLTARDMPQLEYWNVASNPKLVLADEFGSVFYLKALVSLPHDASAQLPERLLKRFAPKPELQEPAQLTTPKEPPAIIVLQPKTAAEIQIWLSGADQIKRQAALNYLQTEAAQGNKNAAHWLGQMWHQGWGGSRDWLKARQYYTQAIQAGNSNAQQSLDALDREAANALTEWGNQRKQPSKGQLAYDLYASLAKDGNKKAQGWIDWLKSKTE